MIEHLPTMKEALGSIRSTGGRSMPEFCCGLSEGCFEMLINTSLLPGLIPTHTLLQVLTPSLVSLHPLPLSSLLLHPFLIPTTSRLPGIKYCAASSPGARRTFLTFLLLQLPTSRSVGLRKRGVSPIGFHRLRSIKCLRGMCALRDLNRGGRERIFARQSRLSGSLGQLVTFY